MEKLIWNKYNILIESEELGRILFNSYTNALLQLDDSLWEDLSSLSKVDNFDDDTLNSFTEEEISYFKKNYILIENQEALIDILHHQSISRIFNKEHLVLTIAPTQNCNFDCTYCYESWRTPGSMNDKTEDAIIRYLEKEIKNNGLSSLELTWYGGEPLLEKGRIKSLGEKISKLGIVITNHEIITNGYLLDTTVVEILKNVGVKTIQITIDGFKEEHNKRRPLIGGKNSFDRIIQNLDNLFNSEYGSVFENVAIRVNVDKTNENEYLDVYKWLKNRYPQLNCIVYPGKIYHDENSTKKHLCHTTDEYTDFCLNLYGNHEIISEKLYPDDIATECLARSPYSMVIGWQGEIYKCFEDLGNEKLVVGNINNENVFSNFELISKYSLGIDHFLDPKCRACSYLPICHGGCPKRRFENKYEGKHNDCCISFKGRLKDCIALNFKKN